MKFRVLGIVVLLSLSVSTLVFGADKADLKTQKDKTSYSIGMNIGRSFQQQGIDVDLKLVFQGMKDIKNGKSLLTEEEMTAALMELQKEMKKKEQEKAEKLGKKNKEEGEAFLTKNKKRKNVVTLPSGLQYEILKKGTGKKPQLSDTVETNYSGVLIDGTEFDSSYRRGKPASFKVEQVIQGWVEALQLMPVGSKWRIYVPSDLAYGNRAVSEKIGPNSVLIFELDLLKILPKG